MTESDEIEELRSRVTIEQEPENNEGITLLRRGSKDVEMNLEGEIIQMPCLDVHRFCKENRQSIN
jgi:hypothetical protein